MHVADRAGHAEIGDHDVVALQQDVVGLDVPVHHALLVGRRQGGADGADDGERAGQREGRLAQEQVAEVLALHVRHGEPEEVAHLARVEDPQDVRVLEPARHADLALEPVLADGARELGVQHLEGDVAAGGEVVREVHRRHAALADLALEAIAVLEGVGQFLRDVAHELSCRKWIPG